MRYDRRQPLPGNQHRLTAYAERRVLSLPERNIGSQAWRTERRFPFTLRVAVRYDGAAVRSVAGLPAYYLAARRCRASGYGLQDEVVAEHGDPPVADAEDLYE